jgi:flagellin
MEGAQTMSIVSLHSNVNSMAAQRHVGNTQSALNTSLNRLSSGFRINSAQDDAAGLGISERLRSQVRGMAVAQRNAEEGFNIVQAAEGAMGETASVLQRMREIAVQAASENLTTTEQKYLNTEFTSLLTEVERVSEATKYNGQKLLDGNFTGKDIQVGADNGADFRISVSIDAAGKTTLGMDAATFKVDILSKAQAAIGTLDTAIDKLNTSRSELGALMSNLQTAANHVSVMRENLVASESRIRDTDIAQETSSFARSQVLQQAGVSMLAQANAQPSIALRLLG